MLGFEQANRYSILDETGRVVALMAEETNTMASAIGRQLLHTHRSFTATVLDPNSGGVIFRIRRPAFLVSSEMFIEDAEGKEVGNIVRRWHLWQRNYDLYARGVQFAKINGGFLTWEFDLEDEQARKLARIDRNFQGFGKELFTDAGKYCVHFGTALSGKKQPLAERPPPDPATPGQDPFALQVQRPLELTERALTLGAAIAIDFDFFSQHSGGPGFMPIPLFGFGGGSEGAGAGAGAAEAGAGVPPPPPPPPSPGETSQWPTYSDDAPPSANDADSGGGGLWGDDDDDDGDGDGGFGLGDLWDAFTDSD
mmetsp:Transcript_24570/g.80238  ORF Transcript_24570/g.80238 Transcript_24570/m.80238 type:complete len:310 (+) Transcript_24570:76-1005(+)